MERDYYEHRESQLPDVQGTPRLNVEALSLFAPLSKTVDVAPAASLSDLGGLDFPSIYTGLIGGDARPLNVADEVEQKPEGAKALRPSDVTRREGQFTHESKQGTWNKATEDYRFTKRQSATHECLTDEQIADLERRGLGQKFEITGLTKPGNGSAEDTGMVTDYQPKEKVKNTSFALGMNYEEGRDTRSPYEKMTDFARAAGRRAADPEGWKTYIQGELDKMIGVGEGLNIAKEQTKGAVAAGWKALTDGTVANFLAKPNAINDPLFHAVGGALTAMAEDPNAVNHALERVGTTIMNASERYSALPNREKGHVIGETMFGLANPEGSTEGGELALKIADGVATHVDAAVMKTIQQSLKAAEEAAKSSPEVAQEMKQMLQNYLRGKGLTGPELEYAGVPKGYFDQAKPVPGQTDNVLAMSKADGLGNEGGGFKGGFDSTGKSLTFSKESGIELAEARPGQDGLWNEVPVTRGNEVHVGLRENLPAGTKTIDRVIVKDGIAESIKSIDPRLDSYKEPSALRNKLNDYVRKMQDYEGQPRPRAGFQMQEDDIEEKILHFGIPDQALTPEQMKVFDEVGRQVMKDNAILPPDKAPLRIKITVLK